MHLEPLDWVQLALGVAGVLSPVGFILWAWRRIRRRAARRRLPRAAMSHDPEQDGILELVTWSPRRRLEPSHLRTTFLRHVARDDRLFATELPPLVDTLRRQGRTGSIAWPTEMLVDARESPETLDFRIAFAPADYSEAIALHGLAGRDPSVSDHLRELHRRGLNEFLAECPPTSLSVGVSVIAKGGRLLVVRRSASVTLFPNEWTPSIHETMKFRDEPGSSEGFFAAIGRGLDEELGLAPGDYSTPTIMNIAFALPAMAFGLNAFVRLSDAVSEEEVIDRYGASHSAFEHDRLAWIGLTPRTLDDFFRSGGFPTLPGAWFYATRYILTSLWRHRSDWITA